MKMTGRSAVTLAATAALVALSACSGGAPEPDPVPVENDMIVNEMMVENVALAAPAPTPSPTATPAATADVPPVTEDEQMLDDADATGMTARADRGDPTPAPVPVE